MGIITTSFSALCGNRAPIAKADSNWVQEDLFGSAAGNVLKSVSHNAPPPPSGTFADVADSNAGGPALKVTTTGTYNLKYGTLVLGADGSYTYTLYTAAQNLAAYKAVQKLTSGETLSESPFVYAISDGALGANSTLNLTVFGNNDQVNIGGIGLTGGDKTVFENDLANGTSPNAAALTKTGSFTFVATDGIDDLKVGGTFVIENGIVKNLNTAIATANGIIKVTSVNLATGTVTYAYTLTKAATHAAGGGDNSITNPLFDTIAVSLTDRDGSARSAAINVKVIDDAPRAADVVDADVLDDEGLAGGIAGGTGDAAGALTSTTGSLGYVAGADGLKSVVLTGPATLGAEAVTSAWNAATNTLTISSAARGAIATVTVTNLATGAYTVTLLKPVLHASGGGENDAILNVTYKVTDKDGDSANGSLKVTIDDDGPKAAHVTDPDVLDDEGLAGGLAGGTGDAAGALTSTTGSLGYSAGADGLKSLVLTGPSILGAEAVTSSWNAATNTLSISSAARGLIATVAITNLATGAYTVTLIKPVLHAAGLGENDAILNVAYTVTDKDNDSATGSLKVTIDDDTPTIGLSNQDLGFPALFVDETDLTTDALNTVNPALFNIAPGADGLASLQFTLAVKAPGVLSGLVDTATKTAIVLTLESGAVVGRVGPGGAVAFTLSIDSTSGQVTLDQVRAVVHDFNPDANDLKGVINDTVKLVATVTDKDGDTASTQLDIGGNLLFLDDGPAAKGDGNLATHAENVSNLNIGTVAALLANDDFGADGQHATTPISIGAGNQGGTVTIGAGGVLLYTNTTANPGPGSPIVETFTYTIKDGDGDTTTATFTVTLTDTGPSITTAPTNSLADEDNLAVIGNNDTAPGDDAQLLTGTISYTLAGDPLGSIALNVSATGLLKLDGVTPVNTIWNAATNTLTGYGGANQADVVFKIVLSAIGNTPNAANTATYTLTLFQPVKHPLQNDPTTVAAETAFEDNVGFTVDVTVTDSDGSTASTSFGVQIDDDTPNQPVLTVNTLPPVSHDETPGDDADAQDVLGTESVSFNGANVQISTLFAALPVADDPHVPGAGPIGYATGALPVTVTGAAAFGADGAAATNAAVYSLDIPDPLGTDSGVSTTEGTKIFLFKLGDGTIVGRVGNELPGGDTANGAGAIAFALRVDPASATLNMVQYLSLQHPNPATFDEAIPLTLAALQLKLTLTDGDGDVQSGAVNIGTSVTFQDDGPAQITPDHAVLSISASGPIFTGQLDIDGNVDPNTGADGGTVRFLPTLSGTDSGLTSNGQPITYFIDPLSPHILQGKVGNAVIFTITLNLDGDATLSNDTYAIDIQGVVDGPKQTSTFVPEAGNFEGGNDPWAGFFDNTNNDSRDLLLTPIGNNTINTTANSAGVGGGASIGSGEAMRIDSVRDLTGDVASSDPGGYSDLDNRDHVFEQHLNTNGLTVTIGGINAASTSDIRLKAFDDPDGDTITRPAGTFDVVGTGNTQLSVTSVALFFNGASVVVSNATIGTGVTYAVPPGDIGGHTGFTVLFVDAGGGIIEAIVGGAVNTLKVGTTTALGYDSLEVWHDDGDTFQIKEFGVTLIDPAKPVNFSVPIQIIDGDNDALLSSIGVTLAPAGDDFVYGSGSMYLDSHIENARGSNGADNISGNGLNNIIYGDAGNDTIEGGGGDDLLIGGLGTDQLTGSGGNDIFMFSSAADSPTQATADRITDFDGNPSGGQDLIDLSLIDANTTTLLVNDAFLFGGASASVIANGITYEVLANTDIVIRGDVNGDTIADFVLLLTDNGTIPPLTADDFLL